MCKLAVMYLFVVQLYSQRFTLKWDSYDKVYIILRSFMFALIVLACSSVEKNKNQDTGETVEAEPTYCERLELTERLFDATALRS